MLFSVLGLGFLIGMQHALEADHLAAVSSLTSRRSGVRDISRHGFSWGLGHTITLLVVGGTAIFLKLTIDDRLASLLECAVGIMLVALGAHVLYRLWRDRVHFHSHTHGDGTTHFHAHTHRDDPARHAASPHSHSHASGMPWRALVVGLMHGMAGSAALVVLTAAALQSPLWGVIYILVFGVGSMIGMALLTAAIAVPLTYTARSLTWANRGLQGIIGVLTVALGITIVADTGAAALAFV